MKAFRTDSRISGVTFMGCGAIAVVEPNPIMDMAITIPHAAAAILDEKVHIIFQQKEHFGLPYWRSKK
jgi:hypothetical protein